MKYFRVTGTAVPRDSVLRGADANTSLRGLHYSEHEMQRIHENSLAGAPFCWNHGEGATSGDVTAVPIGHVVRSYMGDDHGMMLDVEIQCDPDMPVEAKNPASLLNHARVKAIKAIESGEMPSFSLTHALVDPGFSVDDNGLMIHRYIKELSGVRVPGRKGSNVVTSYWADASALDAGAAERYAREPCALQSLIESPTPEIVDHIPAEVCASYRLFQEKKRALQTKQEVSPSSAAAPLKEKKEKKEEKKTNKTRQEMATDDIQAQIKAMQARLDASEKARKEAEAKAQIKEDIAERARRYDEAQAAKTRETREERIAGVGKTFDQVSTVVKFLQEQGADLGIELTEEDKKIVPKLLEELPKQQQAAEAFMKGIYDDQNPERAYTRAEMDQALRIGGETAVAFSHFHAKQNEAMQELVKQNMAMRHSLGASASKAATSGTLTGRKRVKLPEDDDTANMTFAQRYGDWMGTTE